MVAAVLNTAACPSGAEFGTHPEAVSRYLIIALPLPTVIPLRTPHQLIELSADVPNIVLITSNKKSRLDDKNLQ